MRSTVVEKVCRIPDLLKAERNKSFLAQLEDSGYFEDPGSLTANGVSVYLRDHPELIHGWLLYSGDKRTGGWYFDEAPSGGYVVGRYPGGPRTELHDAASACAEFIWHELSEVATRLRR